MFLIKKKYYGGDLAKQRKKGNNKEGFLGTQWGKKKLNVEIAMQGLNFYKKTVSQGGKNHLRKEESE